MTSDDLKGYLNTFNGNVDKVIDEYSSIATTINDLTKEANIIKGSDKDLFNGINKSNVNAKKKVNKIVELLIDLKTKVNKKTNKKIKKLKEEEEAKRRREEEDNNG